MFSDRQNRGNYSKKIAKKGTRKALGGPARASDGNQASVNVIPSITHIPAMSPAVPTTQLNINYEFQHPFVPRDSKLSHFT